MGARPSDSSPTVPRGPFSPLAAISIFTSTASAGRPRRLAGTRATLDRRRLGQRHQPLGNRDHDGDDRGQGHRRRHRRAAVLQYGDRRGQTSFSYPEVKFNRFPVASVAVSRGASARGPRTGFSRPARNLPPRNSRPWVRWMPPPPRARARLGCANMRAKRCRCMPRGSASTKPSIDAGPKSSAASSLRSPPPGPTTCSGCPRWRFRG